MRVLFLFLIKDKNIKMAEELNNLPDTKIKYPLNIIN